MISAHKNLQNRSVLFIGIKIAYSALVWFYYTNIRRHVLIVYLRNWSSFSSQITIINPCITACLLNLLSRFTLLVHISIIHCGIHMCMCDPETHQMSDWGSYISIYFKCSYRKFILIWFVCLCLFTSMNSLCFSFLSRYLKFNFVYLGMNLCVNICSQKIGKTVCYNHIGSLD